MLIAIANCTIRHKLKINISYRTSFDVVFKELYKNKPVMIILPNKPPKIIIGPNGQCIILNNSPMLPSINRPTTTEQSQSFFLFIKIRCHKKTNPATYAIQKNDWFAESPNINSVLLIMSKSKGATAKICVERLIVLTTTYIYFTDNCLLTTKLIHHPLLLHTPDFVCTPDTGSSWTGRSR